MEERTHKLKFEGPSVETQTEVAARTSEIFVNTLLTLLDREGLVRDVHNLRNLTSVTTDDSAIPPHSVDFE